MTKRNKKIFSPEGILNQCLESIQSSYCAGQIKITLAATMISALLAYHLMIIYGHGCPDALNEGLTWYHNADWGLACGRWFTRYVNGFAGNVVMPLIALLTYMLCIWFMELLLIRLWNIKSNISAALLAAAMTISPAVVAQSAYPYMFSTWGISSFLGVLFVFICMSWKRGCWVFPVCSTLLVCAFGLYQSVMGLIAVTFAMTMILSILDGTNWMTLGKRLLRFITTSVLGGILYLVVVKVELWRYGVAESDRVAGFSVTRIVQELPSSAKAAYESYFDYFMEAMLKRNWLYTLLFLLAAVFILLLLKELAEKRRWLAAGMVLLLFSLLPLMSNLIRIVVPYNGVSVLMNYQNVFIIPFLFALWEREYGTVLFRNVGRSLLYGLSICLTWTYLISANATYLSYELSYRYITSQAQNILAAVYRLPEYETGDTIAFAGFIDEQPFRHSMAVYRYAIGMPWNVAFWPDGNGLQFCRYYLLKNYFGIESGLVDDALYNEVVNSEEFLQMGVYPAENSIREINGTIFVKLSETPPQF